MNAIGGDEAMKLHRTGIHLGIALALLAGIGLSSVAAAGDEANVRPGANEKYLDPELDVGHWEEIFEGESREIFRQRDAIVAALDLSPGMTAADVGAGTGLFLEPFAAAVGPTGRVLAVDISPGFVAHLKQRAAAAGLDRVAVVQSTAREAGLPDDSVDLVFLCDVYHHFEYPQAMLADLRRALRPGGALVVVDFERIPGKTREWIVDHVRAGKAEVVDEIRAASFELVKELAIDGLAENYALRFRKP